ncbi:hypothetical protein NKDENANG_00119 [Candidatus Entotheonellaceae bacterium PAL068K]
MYGKRLQKRLVVALACRQEFFLLLPLEMPVDELLGDLRHWGPLPDADTDMRRIDVTPGRSLGRHDMVDHLMHGAARARNQEIGLRIMLHLPEFRQTLLLRSSQAN